jgi:hypothetical protein
MQSKRTIETNGPDSQGTPTLPYHQKQTPLRTPHYTRIRTIYYTPSTTSKGVPLRLRKPRECGRFARSSSLVRFQTTHSQLKVVIGWSGKRTS